MKMISGKKAQGLGFIAIIVLVALLYFVFRYNVETYQFVMSAGDEQANLVTSYTETEKAKEFSVSSIKQAAYEQLWQDGIKSCSFNSICSKQEFLASTFLRFDKTIAMYEPTSELLSVEFPNYNLSFKSCSDKSMEIEAFGYLEGCFLKSDFKFPKYPCEDFNDTTSPKCTEINFADDTSGACEWTGTKCVEKNPDPDCESFETAESCASKANCNWYKSTAENINILSAPIADYQFSIDSNAHVICKIDCAGYEAFLKARDLAIKPTCSISASPKDVVVNTPISFSISYSDDVADPNELELKISGPESSAAAKADMSGSGAAWTYSKSVATAGSYTADLTCTDSAGQKAVAKVSFTVREA